MKIRALIADDEPLARERLRFLLASDTDFEIVGECRNGTEVISSLQSAQPSQPIDVLFLDIQMPGRGGFEALEAIQQIQSAQPITVFVTAHNQYAIRAFEVHALDYLTKPVEPERLRSTLIRVKDRIASNHVLQNHGRLLDVLTDLYPAQIGNGARPPDTFFLDMEQTGSIEERVNSHLGNAQDRNIPSRDYPKRLVIPNGQKDAVVNVNEIEWIEAADYYSCLHVGTRSFMLRATVKQLSTSLNPGQFVRIHRSVIVNMDYVCEIAREGRGEGAVILTRGQRLRMSKAGWQNLLAASRTP
jgi:two-component system LytT family response regulator